MSTLAKRCIDHQVNALNNLYSVIESDEYKQIVDFLSRYTDYSKRIILAGVGKNSNIATKISETMASLGIPSFYLNISHCGHGDFGFIGHNDCIVHISRSGQTEEMINVIEYVKRIRPNVKQILIHCKKDKPKSNADFELFIGSVVEGDREALAPTSSTTALLCILDCISVTLSDRMGFRRMDFLKYHPAGALGAMLAQEKAAEQDVVVTGNLINQ
jgi:arabinose-5-phosphate isomerase